MEYRVVRKSPDELYHYGVKGMKWGVRKDRSSSSSDKSYKVQRKSSTSVSSFDTKKYTDKLKKSKSIEESITLGEDMAMDIRSDIKKLKNKSYEEKTKFIDDVFKKSMFEAEKAGDWIAADELQQQWAFVYDELDEGEYD